jgi:beta-lactam-binding protein with PASTA domain
MNMKKIVVVFILVFMIFTSFGCSSHKTVKQVKVPSVLNLKIDQAEKVLGKEGLILQVVSSKYSESIPIDCIISQNPRPGDIVKEGTIIKAVISNGSKNVTVPNLVGRNFSDVTEILQTIGLNIGDISEKEDSSTVGTVLSQSPNAGTVVAPGSSIKLTVSLGQFVTMPNVIGMNVDKAKALLTSQGFRISHIDETDIVKVSGKVVLYQYPMPGLKVRKGVEVRLKISK